jgi:toxin ParE1/3/4
MAEIRWTEEAHRWLHDIFDYIVTDNLEAVQKVVSGIYEKAQVLRRFPKIGHKLRTDKNGETQNLALGTILDCIPSAFLIQY